MIRTPSEVIQSMITAKVLNAVQDINLVLADFAGSVDLVDVTKDNPEVITRFSSVLDQHEKWLLKNILLQAGWKNVYVHNDYVGFNF